MLSIIVVLMITLTQVHLPVWALGFIVVSTTGVIAYEVMHYSRRGRLIRIEQNNNDRMILHFAGGSSVEGLVSPTSIVHRWYMLLSVAHQTQFICYDAMSPQDYRRLTVNLLWDQGSK